MSKAGVAVVLALVLTPQDARAQTTQAPSVDSAFAYDVGDLIRHLRHKELTPEQQAAAQDPTRSMRAIAPVIGSKPSSGFLVGIAGNVASYRGDPATTQISSSIVSLTFSSKKQTSITERSTIFGTGNRWIVDSDNRAQWTSQDTFGLGTTTAPDDVVNMKFNYFRLYDAVYVKLRGPLFAGAGVHYSVHTSVEPGLDADAGWHESPYVKYSEANGFALSGQTSAGVGLNIRLDTRDNTINPDRGWYAGLSYRPFFKGLLGGDAEWQELYLDVRTYTSLDAQRRHHLAFWMWGDLVTGGVAPYLDLPATGMDKYGRSGRGYAEGRFRGERLLYGEVEYRALLTQNGLLGMVAFLNTTTLTNLQNDEHLFDDGATGAGAGLRLLLNKRSKTNLCFDVGFGKGGSRAIYLAVQEAF